MKRVLYVDNVASLRKKGFFETPLYAANSMELDFHIAFNAFDYSEQAKCSMEQALGIKFHQIDFQRNPLHPRNVKAFYQLMRVVKSEHFDLIHCNSPTGGLLGRLAGFLCRTKVLYQAHGFHFYKGAPIINWCIYYPIEKVLAHLTDALVTINTEDHKLALNKMRLKKQGKIYYVPGVGVHTNIDLSQKKQTRRRIRQQLNIPQDAVILLSVGDVNKNKNHAIVIDALRQMSRNDLYYVVCGHGELIQEYSQRLAGTVLQEKVKFVGYRNDIQDFLFAADAFVFPSFREGLSVALMQAMASQIPCIASRIRGNIDLLPKSKLLFDPNCTKTLINCILLALTQEIAIAEVATNRETLNYFDFKEVAKQTEQIYDDMINRG